MDTCSSKQTSGGEACLCTPLLDCHVCTLGRDAETDELYGLECMTCKNGQFLLGGVCVDACPAGYESVGAGNFNKRCEPLTTTTAPATTTAATTPVPICNPNESSCGCPSNCSSCTIGAAPVCLECDDFFFFLDGTCYSACPEGYEPSGSAPSDQYCVQVSSQPCGSFLY